MAPPVTVRFLRRLSSAPSFEWQAFGRKIPPKSLTKKYKVGTQFLHSELSYRGVVLYPWEARIHRGESGVTYNTTFYQVLVDNRDADMLPMELETLRISEDTSRTPSEVKPIRFKNWDLVPHDEILRYQPMVNSSELIFKHHLLHHFLQEKIIHKQKKGNHITIRGTPTLTYWQKKFSNVILAVYEGEVAVDEFENCLKVTHIPYHLFSKHEGTAMVAHLARFELKAGAEQFEVLERIATVMSKQGDVIQTTNQKMSIHLCGNFNHIYQHTRHMEIPVGPDFSIYFKYLVRNHETNDSYEILLPPIKVDSLLE